MKDFSYYERGNVLYPLKKNYTKYFVYSEGKLLYTTDYGESVPDEYKGYTIENKFDKVGYLRHINDYQEEMARLLEEFKQDLFKELGIEDNPKREILYDKACSMDGSLSMIYENASELVDLIL